MTASTVTGRGHGSAFPGNKGPGNGRDQFQNLNGSHVVAAGSVTLPTGSSPVGSETVTLSEPLTLPSSKYAVILTNDQESSPYVSAKNDVSDKFTSFEVTGEGEVDWVVIRKGF